MSVLTSKGLFDDVIVRFPQSRKHCGLATDPDLRIKHQDGEFVLVL